MVFVLWLSSFNSGFDVTKKKIKIFKIILLLFLCTTVLRPLPSVYFIQISKIKNNIREHAFFKISTWKKIPIYCVLVVNQLKGSNIISNTDRETP